MTLTDVDMSRETQLDQARNKYYKKFDFRLFRAEFDTGSGLNDTYAAGSPVLQFCLYLCLRSGHFTACAMAAAERITR